MTLEGNGHTYRVEFQHINRQTKHGGSKLYHVTGLRGMTTCVVILDKTVAIATVLCSEKDQFNKEQARLEALTQAMSRVRSFQADITAVVAAYNNRKSLRAAVAMQEESRGLPR